MIHTAQHALDKKNFFPLDLAYDAEKQELTVTLDTKKSAPWKRLVENIQRKLLITSVDGQHIAPSHRNGALVFSHVPPDFSLYLNEEHLGTYHNGDNGLRIDEESYRYLTEMEMRRIGTFYNADPYPQQHPLVKGPQNDALLARAKKAVFTDFHSHSSSHISAEGMIQVAISCLLRG